MLVKYSSLQGTVLLVTSGLQPLNFPHVSPGTRSLAGVQGRGKRRMCVAVPLAGFRSEGSKYEVMSATHRAGGGKVQVTLMKTAQNDILNSTINGEYYFNSLLSFPLR